MSVIFLCDTNSPIHVVGQLIALRVDLCRDDFRVLVGQKYGAYRLLPLFQPVRHVRHNHTQPVPCGIIAVGDIVGSGSELEQKLPASPFAVRSGVLYTWWLFSSHVSVLPPFAIFSAGSGSGGIDAGSENETACSPARCAGACGSAPSSSAL